ncbi:MAG: flagellar motor switch protein FliN [Rhodospirillales bacterium]|nr:flagellar motor switch protein FliN [Rhodospirillales bacterium]
MADDDDMLNAVLSEGEDDAKPAADDQPAAPQPTGEKVGTTGDSAVQEVTVEVTAVLGTASMQVSQILKLGRGAVVELNRMVGESIDIRANNRLVAKGEVVVIEDRLGVTMTEIIKSNR